MRTLLVIVLFSAALSTADTIRLKNGRSITADRVSQHGGRVEYEIGDNSYAISQAAVESISAGPPPSELSQEDITIATPHQSVAGSGELGDLLIRNGELNTSALLAVEQESNPRKSAAAYFVAARFEHDRGKVLQSALYLEHALKFAPDNPILLNHYVSVLLEMGRFADALTRAEKAARLAPDSADSFALLGMAYFQTGKIREAERAWTKSLALRPDARIEELKEKASRALVAETGFQQEQSSHFTLRYEGKGTSTPLRREILSTLESTYNDLVRELGFAPRQSIPVVIYTNHAFFDVTRAPSWTGALNDGTLRIPVEGLQSVTAKLSRVLKHEVAHSFINQITHNRCPQWLNEGIAQMVEPQSSPGRLLVPIFSAHLNIPLVTLEGSFAGLSPEQAQIAYLESLFAAQYIRNTYGPSDIEQLLKRIGDGQAPETALRNTIHSSYSQLERELAGALRQSYGG